MKHVLYTHRLSTVAITTILTDALTNAFQIQVQKFSPDRGTITDGIGFIISEINAAKYRKFTIIYRSGEHDPYGHDHWEFCYSSMDNYVAIRVGVKESAEVFNRYGLTVTEI